MKFAKTIIGVGVLVALEIGTFSLTYAKYSKIENEKIKAQEEMDIVSLLEKNKDNSNSKKVESNINEIRVVNDNLEKINDKSETQTVSKSLINNKNDNFIFIGDSRTVAYKDIVDITKYDFITFIAKVSQGYDWFTSTAINKLNDRLTTTDLNYNIVLNLGVNDLHNASKYAQAYNDLAKNNPDHNFFVVSVNPEDEAKMKQYGYKHIGNEQIENFNDTIKSSLSENIHYIDSYSYLTDKGFETTDGLHYNNKTSLEILDFISNHIKSL